MKISDVQTVLNGWDGVEIEMSKLGKARAEYARIAALYKAQINELKAKLDQELNPVEFEQKQCESNITAFVMAHMDEFEVKKHKKLNTGKISVKDSTGYDYPEDEELVLMLKSQHLDELIEVEEKPCKMAIRIAAKNQPDLFSRLGIEVKEDTSIKLETF